MFGDMVMIDNSDVTKQQYCIVYSLPVGFRKIMDEVLIDFSMCLGIALGTAGKEYQDMLLHMQARLDKFYQMMEYSKKWEQNL